MVAFYYFIAGQHDQWNSPKELSIVFLILFLYNLSMMPIICILSLIFSKPSTGMNVLSILNMIISKCPTNHINSNRKKKLIVNFWFVPVFVFLLDSFFHILHRAIYYMFWSFPLCTMIDATIKLPTIHTMERNCLSKCKEYFQTDNCDWDKMCKTEPLCCCKWN